MNMKIYLLALIMMMGFGLNLSAQKGIKNDKATVVFDASMTCENCKARIEKNIAFEKGVTDLKVDLEKKTVTIEYKTSQTTVEKLMAAVEKLGYEVKLHQAEVKQE